MTPQTDLALIEVLARSKGLTRIPDPASPAWDSLVADSLFTRLHARQYVFFPILAGLGLLAIAGGIFYAGHRVGDALDDIAVSVKRASEAVVEVGKRVDAVLDSVHEILEMIRQLPERMQSIVAEQSLQDHLRDMRGRTLVLRNYLTDEQVFRHNISDVQRNCDELAVLVNNVADAGGIVGLLQAAPGVAMWTQCTALMHRADRSGKASPWRLAFHAEFVKRLADFIDEARGIKQSTEAVRDRLPAAWPGSPTLYTFEGTRFQVSAESWRPQYPPGEGDRGGLYRAVLEQPGLPFDDSEFIFLLSTTTRPPVYEPPDGVAGTWYWDVVDVSTTDRFPNPPSTASAYRTFSPISKHSLKISQQMRQLGDLDTFEGMLRSAVFAPPPGWE